MKYVVLGTTGLKVSRLCIGCMSFGGPTSKGFEWSLDYEDSKKVIDRAIDLGINFFDTADVYSSGRSEEILGRALEGRRDDVVIATKVGLPTGSGPGERGLGRKHVLHNLAKSLRHLRTDRIDLYQIHRWDYETPIEEVLRTLTEAVRKEKAVDHIGASSMWAWQLAKALRVSDRMQLVRFEAMQNHYNLAYREEEREMIPMCREERIAVIPWSPLARGFLTGKYRRNRKPTSLRYRKDTIIRERFFKPEDFEVLERLVEVAKEQGAEPAQIALAWLLGKKDVKAPIVGPTRIRQLEELVEAVDMKLTPDQVERLEEPYKPHPVLGHH
ncbi:MAG: aldo/keto reductase [Nitrososphaerales archaeon]|jgi:aryl-alcohol dehydrogenase-like predicted oxidoreductase